MKKLILLAVVSGLLVSGCMNFGTDVVIKKGINSGKIRLGASKSEVASITGYRSPMCMNQRTKANGKYELWDFASDLCGFNLVQTYVLIFKDDTLIEIRTVKTLSCNRPNLTIEEKD